MPESNILLPETIITLPASANQWPAIEQLFGKNGACGGCWCMYWRLPRKEFDAGKTSKNCILLKELVQQSIAPGILAFYNETAIGWVAIGPRNSYPVLNNSRILKSPLLDNGKYPDTLWSITCLFVKKEFRNKGISSLLINAACTFAKANGAVLVEGYPHETDKILPPPFVWTGMISAYIKNGFYEAARISVRRPIMQKKLV